VKYVIDTVRVFLPKCPLTTVGNRFSADELQIVRGEPRIHVLFVRTKSASNGCKRTLWKKKRVQVSDIYDNNWQHF